MNLAGRCKCFSVLAALCLAFSLSASAGEAELKALISQVQAHAAKEDYAQAEAFARRALAEAETSFGNAHPYAAISIVLLGEALRPQEKYGEAETIQRRALAIFEKALGPKHPATATSLINLAAVLEKLGRNDKAAALRRRAAETKR